MTSRSPSTRLILAATVALTPVVFAVVAHAQEQDAQQAVLVDSIDDADSEVRRQVYMVLGRSASYEDPEGSTW